MHRSAGLSLTGLVLAALLGCGGPAPEDEATSKPRPEPGSQEAEETVFDDMIQTQDRARAVEGVTLGHKQQMDAAIEQSVNSTPDESQ